MHACKHQAAAAGAMCTCMHVVGAQGESAARSWPASGIWHLGSGIWDLASGIWDLGSGIWDLAGRRVTWQQQVTIPTLVPYIVTYITHVLY